MEFIILGFQRGAFLKYPIPSPSPNSSICCFRMFHLIQSGVPMGTPSGNLMKPPFLVPLIIVCVFDQCCMIYASTSVRSPITSKRVCEKHRPLFFFHGNFIDFFWGPQSHEATKLLREVPEVLVGN